MQLIQTKTGIFTLVKLHKRLFSLTDPNIVVVSKLFLLYRNENNGLFSIYPKHIYFFSSSNYYDRIMQIIELEKKQLNSKDSKALKLINQASLYELAQSICAQYLVHLSKRISQVLFQNWFNPRSFTNTR